MRQVLLISVAVLISSASAALFDNGGFGLGGGFGGNAGAGFGKQTGFFGQQVGQSQLGFGNRDFVAQQASLDAAAREKAALDAANQVGVRSNVGARAAKGERIAAAKDKKAEVYKNAADFNNLDVAANRKGAKKLGVQIIDEHAFDEKAALSVSDGSQTNFGSRAFANQLIAAESTAKAEAQKQQEAFKKDAISAAAAEEAQLSAAEKVAAQKEKRLQAQNFNQARLGFQSDFFGEEGFGGGGFGRRRRR